MPFYSAKRVAELLPYVDLVCALPDAFQVGAAVPLRTLHILEQHCEAAAALALMPACNQTTLSIKLATGHPAARIHDIRDSLVCHRLEKWYAQGLDIRSLKVARSME